MIHLRTPAVMLTNRGKYPVELRLRCTPYLAIHLCITIRAKTFLFFVSFR